MLKQLTDQLLSLTPLNAAPVALAVAELVDEKIAPETKAEFAFEKELTMKQALTGITRAILLIVLVWVAPLSRSTALAERQDPAEAGYVPERIILTWAGDPSRTQAATWRTGKRAGKPAGEIAPLIASPDFKAKVTSATAVSTQVDLDEPGQSAVHYSVNFEDLDPDTQYCYRVGDAATKTWSEWNVFRTASDRPKPFRFLYVGDAQNHIKSLWPRAIRTAFARHPDIRCIVHAGDLMQDANNDSQWGDWCYSLGWIAATVPALPTPGNHDMETQQGPDGKKTSILSRFWRPHFALPKNGPKDAKHLEGTAYYVDFQGVRFISVDSNHHQDKQQQNWLTDVLQHNSNTWTIVTHHHPIYATGKDADRDKADLRKALRPIYEKYHVDLVLQGHDHSYGRTHKLFQDKVAEPGGPGVIYAVSVSGPKMYPSNPMHWPLMARVFADAQLYQIIEVSEKQLTYTAWSIDGTVIDRFRLTKKGDRTPVCVNEIQQPQ